MNINWDKAPKLALWYQHATGDFLAAWFTKVDGIYYACLEGTDDWFEEAWQIGKVESIKNLMQRYKDDESFNVKVYNGLEARILILERAIDNGEVTKCL